MQCNEMLLFRSWGIRKEKKRESGEEGRKLGAEEDGGSDDVESSM